MYFWNLSVKPSHSSCLKALFKRSNHLFFSWSTLYKALFKQNRLENVIFNRIAQSAVEICQWDIFKVSSLKYLQKDQWKAPFVKHSVQSKTIMET